MCSVLLLTKENFININQPSVNDSYLPFWSLANEFVFGDPVMILPERRGHWLEPENKEGENAIWDPIKEKITEFEFLVLPRHPMNDGNDLDKNDILTFRVQLNWNYMPAS